MPGWGSPADLQETLFPPCFDTGRPPSARVPWWEFPVGGEALKSFLVVFLISEHPSRYPGLANLDVKVSLCGGKVRTTDRGHLQPCKHCFLWLWLFCFLNLMWGINIPCHVGVRRAYPVRKITAGSLC